MSTASKITLLIGLMAFVVSGILLPWKNTNEALSYGFIWAPGAKEYIVPVPPRDRWDHTPTSRLVIDRKGVVVDTTRLLIQWAVILAGTAAGIVFAQLIGGNRAKEPPAFDGKPQTTEAYIAEYGAANLARLLDEKPPPPPFR